VVEETYTHPFLDKVDPPQTVVVEVVEVLLLPVDMLKVMLSHPRRDMMVVLVVRNQLLVEVVLVVLVVLDQVLMLQEDLVV
jgi:hypothetical protein